MKRRYAALALLALLLILGGTLHSAMAYFTTYVIVDGGQELRFGSDTQLTEEISAWTKRLVVKNKDGSEPVYVRATAFAGSAYLLAYDAPNGKWTDGGDGYYYYDEILYGGESAEELDIHIGDVPEFPETDDSFHVVVIYEMTPVLYREDGTPYADWNNVLQTGSAEGGTQP